MLQPLGGRTSPQVLNYWYDCIYEFIVELSCAFQDLKDIRMIRPFKNWHPVGGILVFRVDPVGYDLLERPGTGPGVLRLGYSLS